MTLDKLRRAGKLSYYQATPGGKVQFTRVQPDDYLAQAERKVRKTYKGQT